MADIFRSDTAVGPWTKIGTGTSPFELAEQPVGDWWYTVQNPGDGSDIQPSLYGTSVNIKVFATPLAPSVEKQAWDILVTLPDIIAGTSARLQSSADKSTWTTINDNAPQTLTLAPDVGAWYYRVQMYTAKSVSAFGAASEAVVIEAPRAPVLSLNLSNRTLNWTNPETSSVAFDVYKNDVVVESKITAQSYNDKAMISADKYTIIGFASGQSTASNEVVAQFLFIAEVLSLPEGRPMQNPEFYKKALLHFVPAGTRVRIAVADFSFVGSHLSAGLVGITIRLQSKDFQQYEIVNYGINKVGTSFTILVPGYNEDIVAPFDFYYINIFTKGESQITNYAFEVPIVITAVTA